ncbi:hypothetical protein D9757_005240 [Collybiopsis confluens]|uniref:N-acetyltransferase domain-containing protein n=1 Tax=Collybiopsis confluens TaxID=2823264 RepID=A0A8H5HVQ7_9AGAR|nr:hypothetical protein D9757_005240 [Collybiopsis confluens]
MATAIKPQVPELVSRTGRIKLIQAAEEHDAAYAALRSHPITRKHLHFLPEQCSVDDIRQLRESRAADETCHQFNILWCEKDGETKFIGATIAFHIDIAQRSCETGILISPDVHRTGVATDTFYTLFSYVFEVLEMHRVYLKTDAGNEGMRGWLENVAGARLEMQEKEAWVDMRSGAYTDVVGYAILEWEWRVRVKEVLEKRLGL